MILSNNTSFLGDYNSKSSSSTKFTSFFTKNAWKLQNKSITTSPSPTSPFTTNLLPPSRQDHFVLEPSLQIFIKTTVEETYGFHLHPLFSENCKIVWENAPSPLLTTTAFYINMYSENYLDLLSWLGQRKVIALILCPVWEKRAFFHVLSQKATHRFIFPIGEDIATKKINNFQWPLTAFIWDSRYSERPANINNITVPPRSQRDPIPHPPRDYLPLQSDDFLRARPKQHISAKWFVKWGTDLPPRLLRDVLDGLVRGFSTRYRGGGDFLRDYSSKLNDKEEKKAVETARDGEERMRSRPSLRKFSPFLSTSGSTTEHSGSFSTSPSRHYRALTPSHRGTT